MSGGGGRGGALSTILSSTVIRNCFSHRKACKDVSWWPGGQCVVFLLGYLCPRPPWAGHDGGAASITASMESFHPMEWYYFQKVVLFSACPPPLSRDPFVAPGTESLLCTLLEVSC